MFTNYDSSVVTSDEVCLISTRGYSSCKNKGGDFHEAARVDCQKAGGHLASLTELKIAQLNEKLPTDTTQYWSSEEYYDGVACAYTFSASSGYISYRFKKYSTVIPFFA